MDSAVSWTTRPERTTLLSQGSAGVVEFAVERDAVAEHVHESHDELFYVLEGSIDIRVGQRIERAGPGAFVAVARGTPHAYRHDSFARFLVISVPGGLERYFAESERARGDERKGVAARYDTRFTVD